MSSYFDKKKLLEENSDLYISEYDKSLDTTSLAGIIDAKRSYANAQKQGNSYEMENANRKANSIRSQKGNYTGGSDGSEYNRSLKDYEIKLNGTYSSPYAEDKKKILRLISDVGEFSYNPETDPLFEIYKKIYTELGNDAYERALSENLLRTAGAPNSSAASAAMLAKNKYNSMISSKIPELYEAAYDKYLNEYERLYKQLAAINSLDETEYSRFRDTISDFESDRKYFSDIDSQLREEENNRYEFDSNLEYDLIHDENELNYQKERDANELNYKISKDQADNVRWKEEMEYQKYRDQLDSAINLAKALYGKVPISLSVIKNLMSAVE